MTSSPEAGAPGVATYGSVAALPAAARALLGADFFSTAGWYEAAEAAAVPPGTRVVFVVIAWGGRDVAVFPMMIGAGGASAFSTPYTGLWQPLLAPGLEAAGWRAVWRGLAAWCGRFGTVRLDAMESAMAASLAAGLRDAGPRAPRALPFDHFGNWHGVAAAGWPAYLAARPGQVREAVRRRGKRLMENGGNFAVIAAPGDIGRGIAAYEAVYSKSWKTREPFPDFAATLMRVCAGDGALRLGLLSQGGSVLAAQIWVVRGRWAAVLKLAHDEAAKAHSPGTVLTALMIEYILTRDGVTALDFGRGDDSYKANWTDSRRQRVGLILANPLRVGGIVAIGRYGARRVVRAATSTPPSITRPRLKE